MRWIFERLSPAGRAARLSVLIFHRVLPALDPLFPGEPDVVRFETQMRWIKVWFNVLPLGEAVQRLREGALPARAAAITFDDGYADNCTIALPILRRLGMTATFFVASGYLNGGRMWNDAIIDVVRNASGDTIDFSAYDLGCHAIATLDERRVAVHRVLGKLKYTSPQLREKVANDIAAKANSKPPRDLMMTSDQVRTIAAAGMTIGGHTVTHPILACTDAKTALAEMTEGKCELEAIVGHEVDLFAYPNGKPGADYTAEHVHLAREAGFRAAVTTGWGSAGAGSDLFQIPRFTPWDRSRWRYGLRLATNMRHGAVLAR